MSAVRLAAVAVLALAPSYAHTQAPTYPLPEGAQAAVEAVDEYASTVAVADLAGGPTTVVNGQTVPAYWPGGPSPVTAGFSWPNGVTSATVAGPNDARYATPYGTGYDGVARLIMYNGNTALSGCTGSLIADNIVLTAAHCVAGSTVNRVDATFLGPDGSTRTIRATGTANIITMTGYTGSVVDQRDLAILRLDEVANTWITRYQIYGDNPLFQQTELVGFGRTGNGVTGAIFSDQFTNLPTRRRALNSWEVTREFNTLYAGFNPVRPILIADFDGADPGGVYPVPRADAQGNVVSTWANRTLFQNNNNCRIWDANTTLDPALRALMCSEGYGIEEGLTGSGDSGGGAFIRDADGRMMLAGVTSFGGVSCVPDQRLDAAGNPAPRTDAGCPTGFLRPGSRFGFTSGHVWAGGAEQLRFIAQYAPAAVVPEPSTVALVAAGLAGVGAAARRRRR